MESDERQPLKITPCDGLYVLCQLKRFSPGMHDNDFGQMQIVHRYAH